jgi:hypothetical protein
MGTVSGFQYVYWKKNRPQLAQKFRNELIAEHNQLQNKALEQTCAGFLKEGHLYHSKKLQEVLEMKKKIEAKILSDPSFISQGEQIEVLTDTLCIGVMSHLKKMTAIDTEIRKLPKNSESKKKLNLTRAELVDQVEEATKTLNETWEQLDIILKPGFVRMSDRSSLEPVIQKLRDEAELARKIERRVAADCSDPTPPVNEGAQAQ